MCVCVCVCVDLKQSGLRGGRWEVGGSGELVEARGNLRDNALSPLLSPSGPRRIRHSSICPKAENMTRTSFSLHFFDTMPMNNFLSSTAAQSEEENNRRGREGERGRTRERQARRRRE